MSMTNYNALVSQMTMFSISNSLFFHVRIVALIFIIHVYNIT